MLKRTMALALIVSGACGWMAFAGETPIPLKDMWDTNTLYTAEQVDRIVSGFDVEETDPTIGLTNSVLYVHGSSTGLVTRTSNGAVTIGSRRAGYNIGEYSLSNGRVLAASGQYSHSEGFSTESAGAYSHAEGYGTVANSINEHAEGKYNASHTNSDPSGTTLSSIGVGTNRNDRMNAVETMADGKTFILNVGGYDGTNPTGQTNAAKDIATVIAALESRTGADITTGGDYNPYYTDPDVDISRNIEFLDNNLEYTNERFSNFENEARDIFALKEESVGNDGGTAYNLKVDTLDSSSSLTVSGKASIETVVVGGPSDIIFQDEDYSSLGDKLDEKANASSVYNRDSIDSMLAEKLDLIDVVDPLSTNSVPKVKQAASAYRTRVAINDLEDRKRDKNDLDVTTVWECTPELPDGCKILFMGTGWMPAGNYGAFYGTIKGNKDSTELSWSASEWTIIGGESYDFTARRINDRIALLGDVHEIAKEEVEGNVVDPASATATGKAADALAVKEALAGKRDYDDLSYSKAAWPQDGEGFFRVSVSDGREYTLTPLQEGTGWGVNGSVGDCEISSSGSAYRIFVRDGGEAYQVDITAAAEQTVSFYGVLSAVIRAFAPDTLALTSEVDTKLDSDDALRLFYPGGEVKSWSEITPMWDGTTGLKYELDAATQTAKVLCFTSGDDDNNSHLTGRVVVPPYVVSNGVKYVVVGTVVASSVGDNANLKSIVLPEGMTSIGGGAFSSCINLTSVTIPDSVTSIGGGAFSSCTSLTSVTIPDSVTSIGTSAFQDCYRLTSVTIPDSVGFIDTFAFYGCNGLTSVTIGNSVKHIGWSAFDSCSGLTSVTIPSSVTSIGAWAFSDCSGLMSVTIPSSVTSIDGGAFSGTPNLGSVTFKGKTDAEVNSMGNHPWGIINTSVIKGTIADSVAQDDSRPVTSEGVYNALGGKLDSAGPYAADYLVITNNYGTLAIYPDNIYYNVQSGQDYIYFPDCKKGSKEIAWTNIQFRGGFDIFATRQWVDEWAALSDAEMSISYYTDSSLPVPADQGEDSDPVPQVLVSRGYILGHQNNKPLQAAGYYVDATEPCIAIGTNAVAAATKRTPVAVGGFSSATKDGSIAIGGKRYSNSTVGASATGDGAIAIGASAVATGTDSVQIGFSSTPNSSPNSFRFRNTEIVNSSGFIPAASIDKSLTEDIKKETLSDNKVYVKGMGWTLTMTSPQDSSFLETLYPNGASNVWSSADGGTSGFEWGMVRSGNEYAISAEGFGSATITTTEDNPSSLTFQIGTTNYLLTAIGPYVPNGQTYVTSSEISELLSVISSLKARIAVLEAIHGITNETTTVETDSITEDEAVETASFAPVLYDSSLDITDESRATNGFSVVTKIADGDLIAKIAEGSTRDVETSTRQKVAQKIVGSRPFVYDSVARKCYYQGIDDAVPSLTYVTNINLVAQSNVKALEEVLRGLGVKDPAEAAPYVRSMSLNSTLFWVEKEQCCYYYETTDNFTKLSAVTNINLTAPENVVPMRRFYDSKMNSSKSPAVFACHLDGSSPFESSISVSSSDAYYLIEGARFNRAKLVLSISSGGKEVYSREVPSAFATYEGGETIRVKRDYLMAMLYEYVDMEQYTGGVSLTFTVSNSAGETKCTAAIVP